MKKLNNRFHLPRLSFSYGMCKKKNVKIQNHLPFSLTIDKNTGLIKQPLNSKLKNSLKIYYKIGGYGSSPLGEGDYAKRQANEVFGFITTCLKSIKRDIKDLNFLEIGASYGYLLYLLKKHGAKDVAGLEPGIDGVTGSKKYKLKMVKDFFPSKLLKNNFDFIFSHCVVEHVEDPLFFFRGIFNKLNANGTNLVIVPSCRNKLAVGDLSIISHQHISYFTPNSIRVLMEKAGFRNIRVITSKKRALLYAWGQKPASNTDRERKLSLMTPNKKENRVFSDFISNYTANVNTIQGKINELNRTNRKIGLYAPCTNLLSLINFKNKPRVFNSDKYKQGKFTSGINLLIESPFNLVKNPVDALIICPIDYDSEIKNFLKKQGLSKNMDLISLKNIYEKVSNKKYIK